MANKGGFSWKRATGVTRTKQKISRATGVPLTKSGRQRKVGKMATGGGCLVPILSLVAISIVGCGAAASTPAPATATPEPTVSIADRIAILEQGIHFVYCDTEPVSEFCGALARDGDKFRLEALSDNSIYIYSTMGDSPAELALAATACEAIAFSANDPDTGEPLGIRHFRVLDRTGQVELADCNFPG